VILPSDFDHAVSVQDVSLTYRVAYEKAPTLKGAILNRSRKKGVREIEALRNVSFDVAHGSVLGIVGSNGAGKSTLMRSVAGILPPTTGRIEVNGRVSTLLALGIGFNSKLSGRENVILGGLAGGLTKDEVEDRYQEITDFADLGDFMDLPMKTYSSGMKGRVNFGMSMAFRFDYYLIDEGMSAGDPLFRKKAQAVFKDRIKESSVILVSHNINDVREMCDVVVVVENGQATLFEDVEEGLGIYQNMQKVNKAKAL
jgi:lipopolysaccharide transport system ATP-binding protein/teichoic acid transport system ATP-binding protein